MSIRQAGVDTFHKIWDDAVEKYKNESGNTIGNPSNIPNDMEGLMKNVDERQKDFTAFRKKRKQIFDVLDPLVNLIKRFADTMGEGAALAPHASVAKPIFFAISGLIAAAKDVEKSYDSIIDLFESLSYMLQRYEIHLVHEPTPAIREIMVQALAHMLTILGLATKRIKNGRTLQFFKALVGKNGDVQQALDKLARLTSQEHQLVSATTRVVTNDILSKLCELAVEGSDDTRNMLINISEAFTRLHDDSSSSRSALEEIRSAVCREDSRLRALEYNQERKELVDWLSAPEVSRNQNAAREKRMSGSGAWFIESSTFLNWKNEDGSAMWLSGGPGWGKTVLSSTVIDMLDYVVATKPRGSAALAYHYFDFRDPAKQTCESLILSLIRRLLDHCPDIPDTLRSLHQQCLGQRGFSLIGLKSTLQDMLESFEISYLVIDALDECATDQWSNVFQFLTDLCEWSLCSNTHVLLTSRPEHDIKQRLDRLIPSASRIQLGTELGPSDDIRRYISSAIHKEHSNFRRWPPNELAEIEDTLVRGAHGMFRWVYCQLEELRKCVGPASLRQALHTLPETLDETYERILKSIYDSPSRKYARQMLLWLAFSVEPLSVKQVAETLAFSSEEDPSFVAADRLPNSEDVLGICSTLIVSLTSDGKNTLQLAHFSVKEYLVAERIRSSAASHFYLEAQLAHAAIVHACLVNTT
ncbi:uncharacterized protein STEHIDRAFT_139093 [Stereum hirsutum FP-91666 SS1]|uniref:uncharacterized protein n=1 Tax=Stereum hirsutum (strain FP-91666) TaxID=721885 RepID=UPI000440EE7B|nr:uncharacterized protein STEHIDRAFT_139093 [Stereum hirsutum FP-91666 SS1]EIM87391.1 hypothetical protein STEHIDRAFT_139093 [Stereum hirsutum FP-91666 SS1]